MQNAKTYLDNGSRLTKGLNFTTGLKQVILISVIVAEIRSDIHYEMPGRVMS